MADLFYALKLKNKTVEMCPEIIKQWAWDGIKPNKYDQYFLMGQEIKQQSRLFGKVDFAISDSPVLQNAFYNWYLNGEDNLYQPFIDYRSITMADGHEFRNFMLFRNKPFEPNGRYQTAEEADNIAIHLVNYLEMHGMHFPVLNGKDHERTEQILEELCLT